ncbi:hypothetical protein BT69DRAFT_871392 [Atractiella rhizophila]|nr:hypothetical protein BT69DRAFT_871392 [Atractiella rhizophila]
MEKEYGDQLSSSISHSEASGVPGSIFSSIFRCSGRFGIAIIDWRPFMQNESNPLRPTDIQWGYLLYKTALMGLVLFSFSLQELSWMNIMGLTHPLSWRLMLRDGARLAWESRSLISIVKRHEVPFPEVPSASALRSFPSQYTSNSIVCCGWYNAFQALSRNLRTAYDHHKQYLLGVY